MSGACGQKTAVIIDNQARERLWAFVYGKTEESVSSATVDKKKPVMVRSCSKDSWSV